MAHPTWHWWSLGQHVVAPGAGTMDSPMQGADQTLRMGEAGMRMSRQLVSS